MLWFVEGSIEASLMDDWKSGVGGCSEKRGEDWKERW